MQPQSSQAHRTGGGGARHKALPASLRGRRGRCDRPTPKNQAGTAFKAAQGKVIECPWACRQQRTVCAVTKQPGTSHCTCWRRAQSDTCQLTQLPCSALLALQRQSPRRPLQRQLLMSPLLFQRALASLQRWMKMKTRKWYNPAFHHHA